jgi:hypothetical protein
MTAYTPGPTGDESTDLMLAVIWAQLGIILLGLAIWGLVVNAQRYARGHTGSEVGVLVGYGVLLFFLIPFGVLFGARHRGQSWRRSILLSSTGLGAAILVGIPSIRLFFG